MTNLLKRTTEIRQLKANGKVVATRDLILLGKMKNLPEREWKVLVRHVTKDAKELK